MKRFVLPIVLLYAYSVSNAQIIRQTQPVTKKAATSPSKPATTDTVPTIKTEGSRNKIVIPKGAKITTPANASGNYKFTDSYIQPNLKWVESYPGDVDNKNTPWITSYYSGEIKYVIGKTETPQWQADFLWHHIPANAAAARFEISTLPFPYTVENDFSGIIETRTINKTKADSVKFNISFKQTIKEVQYSRSREKTFTRDSKNPAIQINNAGTMLDALKTYGTYYVRLLVLDGRGSVISKAVNSIRIVPEYINFPPPPIPTSEDSLQSDYEITAINYIKPHYPEAAFANCIVVTGHPEIKEEQKQKDIFGPAGNLWKKEEVNQFKNSFPVGTIICPSPPKEKSWYEKAFNSVVGAAEIAVNGASKIYSETKDYLKSKFSEYMCNYDPVTSANKKLLEQTGLSKKQIDNACNVSTGVAFEIAMSYAGMPPSIPNFDEMCKLAEGQIVELLIQKAAEQTGMPCDEICVALIMEGFDKLVEESAKKNTQNGGFFNYKPDPRGQYRLPYVEIEVTRKRQSQKGKKIITNLSFTPSVEKTFSSTDKKTTPYTATVNSKDLYEYIQLPVPYLDKVGDKIKLVAVLTPKFAFFITDCITGKITGVQPKQHICLGWNVIETLGEDPKNSSGYNMMLNNSVIAILPSFKIKTAPEVTTKFTHHQ